MVEKMLDVVLLFLLADTIIVSLTIKTMVMVVIMRMMLTHLFVSLEMITVISLTKVKKMAFITRMVLNH